MEWYAHISSLKGYYCNYRHMFNPNESAYMLRLYARINQYGESNVVRTMQYGERVKVAKYYQALTNRIKAALNKR